MQGWRPSGGWCTRSRRRASVDASSRTVRARGPRVSYGGTPHLSREPLDRSAKSVFETHLRLVPEIAARGGDVGSRVANIPRSRIGEHGTWRSVHDLAEDLEELEQ